MNSTEPLIRTIIDSFQTFNSTHWPYTFKVEIFSIYVAERWCYQNFKSKYWSNKGPVFAFKHKEDYEWFVLRWS